jgi:hypothetical protein
LNPKRRETIDLHENVWHESSNSTEQTVTAETGDNGQKTSPLHKRIGSKKIPIHVYIYIYLKLQHQLRLRQIKGRAIDRSGAPA